MPELNLPACPICQAQDELTYRTRTLDDQVYAWYECPRCGSVLLAVDDRWAYQKIGLSGKTHLLKQPLTRDELLALLPVAPGAVEPEAMLPLPSGAVEPEAVSETPSPVQDIPARPDPRVVRVLVTILALATVATLAVGALLLLARQREAEARRLAGVPSSTATGRATATPPGPRPRGRRGRRPPGCRRSHRCSTCSLSHSPPRRGSSWRPSKNRSWRYAT